MQRPTNNQIGILSVCAFGAFLLFLVFFMLIGGSGFVAAIFKALIIAVIVAAAIYLFAMTGHGKQLVGEASTRLSAAAAEAKAKLEEKAVEAKSKIEEKAAEAKAKLDEKSAGSPEDDGAKTDAAVASHAAAAVAAGGMPGAVPPSVAEPDPEPAPEPETAEAQDGTRPAGLDAPRGGEADDLKKIKGVGPKLEQTLNEMGYYHFDQIANWSEAEVAWVDENLKGFKGRVSRDNWVEQARTLAAGGETEFSKKVDEGDVY